MSSCTFKILEIFLTISESQTDSIAVAGTVVTFACLNDEPDESS
jgi:hypothetical protein